MKHLVMTLLIMAMNGLATTALALQPTQELYLRLPDGREIWTEVYKPSATTNNSKPIVIFVNGLTYTTKPWQAMISSLVQRGYSVVAYDPWGMGKTLEKGGPIQDMIPLDKQVEDLKDIIVELGIQSPAVAGLSYGGAVALQFAISYPDLAGPTLLMAPFVKALSAQDQQIQQKVKMHRLLHPQDKATDDELYDKYLHDLIFQTYPIYEPVVKEHPWRLEAIYQMVRGVRRYVASKAVENQHHLPLYLILAGHDQYVPKQDHQELWAAVPRDSRHSVLTIEGCEHKIPEAQPEFAAAWIDLILKGQEEVVKDQSFTGKPKQKIAIGVGSGTVAVP